VLLCESDTTNAEGALRECLALERRRLGNRSREEGRGNARAGTASGAETSVIHPSRDAPLSQAVLSGNGSTIQAGSDFSQDMSWFRIGKRVSSSPTAF
jgi:hypothetical protein